MKIDYLRLKEFYHFNLLFSFGDHFPLEFGYFNEYVDHPQAPQIE